MSEVHINNIIQQINNLIENNSELKDDINKLPDSEKKIIVLNNSFLYREKIKTNKNIKYLAFYPNKLPVEKDNCFVITGPQLKKDYSILTPDKIISKNSLENSIEDEVKSLAHISHQCSINLPSYMV